MHMNVNAFGSCVSDGELDAETGMATVLLEVDVSRTRYPVADRGTGEVSSDVVRVRVHAEGGTDGARLLSGLRCGEPLNANGRLVRCLGAEGVETWEIEATSVARGRVVSLDPSSSHVN